MVLLDVEIPHGLRGGDEMEVMHEGLTLTVTIPKHMRSGDLMTIEAESPGRFHEEMPEEPPQDVSTASQVPESGRWLSAVAIAKRGNTEGLQILAELVPMPDSSG